MMQSRGKCARFFAFTLPLALALGGCKPTNAPDDYRFERAEWVQTEFKTRIVLLPNQAALLKVYPKPNPSTAGDLVAFSVISADHKSCTVYMIDPRVRYAPQWLGHEVTHCIFGEYHPQQTAERL